MAAFSSLLHHQTHFVPFPKPNPNPKFATLRSKTFKFSARVDRERTPPPPPPPPPPPSPLTEKKSLAVATEEHLLGLASLIIRTKSPNKDAEVFFNWEEVYFSGREGGVESIASVVQDPVDQEVIWEQEEKDVEAEKERTKLTSPGFSFSAGGLLFPYHIGVAQLLLDKGYIKETTPLAGSSAGAIVCAAIASGNSMQVGLQAAKILAEDCRLNGTAFRLGAVLRDVLNKFLPDDVHTRCSGRVRVAITQLFRRSKGLLVDHFDSKKDVIDAVFTSSFIPWYLAPRPATIFRNRLCIDGGLTLFMPPTSASKTVRVCAFPANRLGLTGIGISPDCNPENRATLQQLLTWAIGPAEDHILDKLYELGYLDAAVWADQNPMESIVTDEDNPNGP